MNNCYLIAAARQLHILDRSQKIFSLLKIGGKLKFAICQSIKARISHYKTSVCLHCYNLMINTLLLVMSVY